MTTGRGRGRTRTSAWVLALAVMGLGSVRVTACERLVSPPTSFPRDQSLAAFSAVVTKSIPATLDLSGMPRAPGLVVRVTDPLTGVPGEAAVAVYPLGTGIDCRPIARDHDDLLREYPVGAKVTVVGTAVEAVGTGTSSMRIVVSNADDFGHVARAPEQAPRTPDGYLDFRVYREQGALAPSGGDALEVAWRDAHRSWFEDYEFLRCLAALETPLSPAERIAVLGNMAYHSRYDRMRPAVAKQSYRELLGASGVSGGRRRLLMRQYRAVHTESRRSAPQYVSTGVSLRASSSHLRTDGWARTASM